MLNIAILTPGFLPVPSVDGGAIETIITDLINSNEKVKKMNLDVYSRYDSRIENFSYSMTNVITLRKNIFQKGIDFILNKIRIKHDYRFKIALKIMNQKNKYDYVIVENNMFLYKYIREKYKNSNSSRFIFHLHNDIGKSDKPIKLCQYIAKTVYKVIVVSNFLQNRWIEETQSNNVRVLYNTIDIDKFVNAKKDLMLLKKNNINTDDIIFEYCGRLDEEKGAYHLVEAFNELCKKYNNIHLIVIGKAYFDYKYEKKIKSVSNPKITFLGAIDNKEISKYISLSDVVVIPTVSKEAFGITAIEAMACGKTVIASANGGLPEIINKKYGILFLPDNFKENLMCSMKKILDNNKLLDEYGKKSQRYIINNRNKFDKKLYYNNFYNIIRDDYNE